MLPSTKHHGSKDPGLRETTEWEDILVKKGIVQPDAAIERRKAAVEESKRRGVAEEQSALEKVARRFGESDKEELDKLEDEMRNDSDDEAMFERFRSARLEELKREAVRSRFGEVIYLARNEFNEQVKEASKTSYVVIELYQKHIEDSIQTSKNVSDIARAHPDVKFVRMVANDCIENWPDTRVPTLFVYSGGELVGQLIGPAECSLVPRQLEIALKNKVSKIFTSIVLPVEDGVKASLSPSSSPSSSASTKKTLASGVSSRRAVARVEEEKDKDEEEDDW